MESLGKFPDSFLAEIAGQPDALRRAAASVAAAPCRLAERVRERPATDRPFVVSVTNGLANSLAGLADLPFDTAAGVERGPSTGTFGASLVVLAAMARALAGAPIPEVVDGLIRDAAQA